MEGHYSLKIYLDNCCFNRPFDDQSQLLISLETQAKLEIQRRVKNGEIKLVTSFMIRLENGDNPFENRRTATESFITQYTDEYIGIDKREEIEDRAREIMETGIKEKDAIHVACAIEAGCDYLISTDHRLLKYRSEKIKLVNPIDFVRLEAENNEQ